MYYKEELTGDFWWVHGFPTWELWDACPSKEYYEALRDNVKKQETEKKLKEAGL